MKEPSKPKVKIKHVLVAGFSLQLAMTVGLYLAGVTEKFPHLVDTNGIAVSFASDGISYRWDAESLRDTFVQSGVVAWFNEPAEFHTRLYSISFILFGWLFGFTILGAAPLNVLYFLLILNLVFSIGKEAFDIRAGVLAAGIVALWPSFLLHSTQLLRDQLFIAALLVVILTGMKWLRRTFSWRRGLAVGAVAGVAGVVLWRIRSETWEVIAGIVILVSLALAIRQWRERKFLLGNSAGAALLLLVTLSAPHVLYTSSFYQAEIRARRSIQGLNGSGVEPVQPLPAPSIEPSTANPPTGLSARIRALRQRFIERYPGATSNIDTDVALNSTADIIHYLPRAAAIGFFAPFPNMWFASGKQTGGAGRLLSGLETLAMYLFEVMAVVGLWIKRDQISAWLLWLVAALGLIALALVVINLGTLYRMRYVFWMLLIIVGAVGVLYSFSFLQLRRNPDQPESSSIS